MTRRGLLLLTVPSCTTLSKSVVPGGFEEFFREMVHFPGDGPFFAFRPYLVPMQHVQVENPVVWRTDGRFRARNNRWCWF